MKIGILLVGISHTTIYDNTHTKKTRSYLDAVDNLYQTIIDPLKKENIVNIYLTTYNNDEIDNIYVRYNPIKTLILDEIGSTQRGTFLSGLKLLENQDLDFIIVTRFDITFNFDIHNLNVNYDKFNFVFKEKENFYNRGFTTDVFYAFNYKYLKYMILASEYLYNNINSAPAKDLHPIYRELSKYLLPDDIHFMFDDEHLSHNNHIFKTMAYLK